MARPALSAARAVEVVNFLAARPTERFTLSDLVRRLGINVASLHAVLAVLEDAEYVTRDPAGRSYALGPMLVPVGHAALAPHHRLTVARDQLRDLAIELGLTGLIVGATAVEMVIIDEVPVRGDRTPSIGQRVGMTAPMGGLFRAWSTEPDVEQWIHGAPSRVERADLRAWLAAIRARGYAVGLETPARHGMRRALRELRDEPGSRPARGRLRRNVAQLGDIATVVLELSSDRSYDVSHVAVPVFGPDGEVEVGLYVLGFRRALSAYEIEQVAGRLLDVATRVSRGSGGGPPAATGAGDQPAPAIW